MSTDSHNPGAKRRRVSLVTTVLNAKEGCAVLLDSLARQTRLPDEAIVVDGGSTDGTQEVVRRAIEHGQRITLIVKPGLNIGAGRNAGIEAAAGEIILSTDSGCRLDPHWVENMVRRFEERPDTELVAGVYKIDPHTLTEAVVGTATMRGALDPVDPRTFNPSCRSMAFTKSLWQRAGGFPDWIKVDDTLFNLKLRRMSVNRRFAADALVFWRPRSTLADIYRQFRHYSTWRGHTQLDAESIRYNIRNLLICAALLPAGLWYPPIWTLPACALVYFYVWSYHRKSRRVAAKLGTWRAYPLCLFVYWTMIAAGISGYLTASCQRWRNYERYGRRTEAYLARTSQPNVVMRGEHAVAQPSGFGRRTPCPEALATGGNAATA